MGVSVQEASTQCAADWETLPTATGARDWQAAGVARAVATIAGNNRILTPYIT